MEGLTDQDIDRIIEMAWEDRTPFEAICYQFSITEPVIVELMRRNLKSISFKNWRKRVHSGISQKHKCKRESSINRFKSPMQKSIANNKISKR